MLQWISFFKLLILLTFYVAKANVVTAPFSPDKPLVNPAAGAFRLFSSAATDYTYQKEKDVVGNLTDSTIETEISIHRSEAHGILNWNFLFAEANYSLQFGKKETTTKVDSTRYGFSSKGVENDLALEAVQGIIGFKIKDYFSFGYKILSTAAEFSTINSYSFVNDSALQKVVDNSDLDASYTINGWGSTLQVFKTGVFLAYGEDYIQFKSREDSVTTYSTDSSGVIYDSSFKSTKTFSNKITKKNYGIGFFYNFRKDDILRLECGLERMPPLKPGSDLNKGKLDRYSAEVSFYYFRLGVEYTKISGYYVDALNLIPYFYHFQEFSNTSKSQYSIFGGLKFSKGHSVNASYMRSTDSADEQLDSAVSQKYPVDKTTSTYGVGYTYLF